MKTHMGHFFYRFLFVFGFLCVSVFADATTDKVREDNPQVMIGDTKSLYETQLDESFSEEIDDPFEPFNRAMFEINFVLDTFILDPVANVYRFAFPNFVQRGVRNMLSNLGTPFTMLNSLFQGRAPDALESFLRFLVNTTLGFLGTVDVASELGLNAHDEDFGQTMGVWGAGPGPYLVLPLLGPSSGRDAVGKAVDIFGDPTNIAIRRFASKNYIYARMGASAVSYRAANIEDYDALKQTSVDLYATMRSLYSQYRHGLIEEEKKSVGTKGPEAFLNEEF